MLATRKLASADFAGQFDFIMGRHGMEAMCNAEYVGKNGEERVRRDAKDNAGKVHEVWG